jgi:tetraacyldisaccharide 4'-kinase
VIVCDDGLQHYALARDVEIAVEDARGHGNGLLLPAGPLREPGGRTVDATVVNGSARRGAYTMTLQPDGFYAVRPPAAPIAIEALRGKRLHAVAGIGHPQRFFAQLDALGLAFVPHPFPDHHAYAATDLDFADCDFVLMTEKDAVKCRTFDRSDLVALRVAAEVDAALAEFIAGKLHGLQTP